MKINIFSLSHDTDFGTGTTLFGTKEEQEAETRAICEEYLVDAFDDKNFSNMPLDDLVALYHDSNRRGDSQVREAHVVDVPLKIKIYYYTWDTEDGIGTCIFNTAEKRDAALREVLLSYAPQTERELFDSIPELDKLYDETIIAGYLDGERFACGESDIDV